jgi:hypothetical protein
MPWMLGVAVAVAALLFVAVGYAQDRKGDSALPPTPSETFSLLRDFLSKTDFGPLQEMLGGIECDQLKAEKYENGVLTLRGSVVRVRSDNKKEELVMISDCIIPLAQVDPNSIQVKREQRREGSVIYEIRIEALKKEACITHHSWFTTALGKPEERKDNAGSAFYQFSRRDVAERVAELLKHMVILQGKMRGVN